MKHMLLQQVCKEIVLERSKKKVVLKEQTEQQKSLVWVKQYIIMFMQTKAKTIWAFSKA